MSSPPPSANADAQAHKLKELVRRWQQKTGTTTVAREEGEIILTAKRPLNKHPLVPQAFIRNPNVRSPSVINDSPTSIATAVMQVAAETPLQTSRPASFTGPKSFDEIMREKRRDGHSLITEDTPPPAVKQIRLNDSTAKLSEPSEAPQHPLETGKAARSVIKTRAATARQLQQVKAVAAKPKLAAVSPAAPQQPTAIPKAEVPIGKSTPYSPAASVNAVTASNPLLSSDSGIVSSDLSHSSNPNTKNTPPVPPISAVKATTPTVVPSRAVISPPLAASQPTLAASKSTQAAPVAPIEKPTASDEGAAVLPSNTLHIEPEGSSKSNDGRVPPEQSPARLQAVATDSIPPPSRTLIVQNVPQTSEGAVSPAFPRTASVAGPESVTAENLPLGDASTSVAESNAEDSSHRPGGSAGVLTRKIISVPTSVAPVNLITEESSTATVGPSTETVVEQQSATATVVSSAEPALPKQGQFPALDIPPPAEIQSDKISPSSDTPVPHPEQFPKAMQIATRPAPKAVTTPSRPPTRIAPLSIDPKATTTSGNLQQVKQPHHLAVSRMRPPTSTAMVSTKAPQTVVVRPKVVPPPALVLANAFPSVEQQGHSAAQSATVPPQTINQEGPMSVGPTATATLHVPSGKAVPEVQGTLKQVVVAKQVSREPSPKMPGCTNDEKVASDGVASSSSDAVEYTGQQVRAKTGGGVAAVRCKVGSLAAPRLLGGKTGAPLKVAPDISFASILGLGGKTKAAAIEAVMSRLSGSDIAQVDSKVNAICQPLERSGAQMTVEELEVALGEVVSLLKAEMEQSLLT